jgi:hypothetical protein
MITQFLSPSTLRKANQSYALTGFTAAQYIDQTLVIVNLPDRINVGRNEGSLSLCPVEYDCRAIEAVFKVIGYVKLVEPRFR